MRDDVDLMLQVSRGDTGAFRILMERYQKPVYNFFLRSTGSIEDAEDLTQQLFINMFRSARRYRPSSSFKTYLYRIAANMAVSFARKRRRRGTGSLEVLSEDGFEPASNGVGGMPDEAAERGELKGAYVEALLRLPAGQRAAIELRVGRGLSYREIAEVMGKSVPAVESMISRAREKLAHDLRAFRGKDEL